MREFWERDYNRAAISDEPTLELGAAMAAMEMIAAAARIYFESVELDAEAEQPIFEVIRLVYEKVEDERAANADADE